MNSGGWSHHRYCITHNDEACDCEPFMKNDQWELHNDVGMIGCVQCFDGEGKIFYGSTLYGRTGAVADRMKCQKLVEEMLVTGHGKPHGEVN